MVSPTEQRLDKLERQLDRRIDSASSKATRTMMLILMIVLAALALAALLTNRYIASVNSRLDEMERAGRAADASNAKTQSAPAPQSSELASVNARLTSLENLQGAMIDTSKGALEQMNFVFAIVAAFFGLFSLFFAYRQVVADNSRDKHDEEMRGLVGSFQNNITVINSLISSLEQVFSYRKEIESRIQLMDTQLSKVEQYKERAEQTAQKIYPYCVNVNV